NDRLSRFGIDQTPSVGPGTGEAVSVTPEISQFGSLAPDDEQGRPATQSRPTLARASVLLPHPEVTESGMQTLADDASTTKPYLFYSVRSFILATVPHVIDPEHANARNR